MDDKYHGYCELSPKTPPLADSDAEFCLAKNQPAKFGQLKNLPSLKQYK